MALGAFATLTAELVRTGVELVSRDLYDSYRGRLKPDPTTGTDQIPLSQPRPPEPGEQPSPDVTPTAHR
jgi:hypothetical protein